MEELSKLVDASLAKHGVEPGFDHLLLQWSGWFRCESTFSMLLVAAKPGVFVLAEEVPFAGEADGRGILEGERRVLDVFHVGQAEDLGLALGRLFLPGSRLGERLASGRAFVRYAVIEDRTERALAAAFFRQWVEIDLGAEGGSDGWPAEAFAVSNHRPEQFIIRFPFQTAWRTGKEQAGDEAGTGAGKAEARVSGSAPWRLPSGF